MELLSEAVRGAKRLKLVILDACRNNPFLASMKRTIQSRSVGRGLSRQAAPAGILIAYAAREGTTADDGTGRNSPYTAALLKKITQPGLEVQFMFRHVRDSVIKATNGRQEPFTYGSLPADEIFFVKPSPKKPPQVAQPTKPSEAKPDVKAMSEGMELALWQEVKNSNDKSLLLSYLNRFPKGVFRDVAISKIEALARQQAQSGAAKDSFAKADPDKSVEVANVAPDAGSTAVDEKSALLERLRTIRATIDRTRTSCNVFDINQIRQSLDSESKRHPDQKLTIESEAKRLTSIESQCKVQARKRAVLEADRQCRRQSNHSRAITSGSGFECTCNAPYEMDAATKQCVKPMSLIKQEANNSCKRYGNAYAVNIKSETDYRCQCVKGEILNDGETKCYKPSKKQLKQLANKQCKKQYGSLTFAVNIKSVEKFQCNCPKNYRWNSKQTACYKPSQKQLRKEAVAGCRKKYGSRFIKLVRQKNGTYLCNYKYSRKQMIAMAMKECRKRFGKKAKRVRLSKDGSQYQCFSK